MDPAMATDLCTLLADVDDVCQLPTSVKRDIRFLRMELEAIQAVLRMISERPADELDEQVKIWEQDLKGILADPIVGMVNNWRARQSRKADTRGLKGFVAGIEIKLADLRGRHKLVTSIKDLKCRLKELAKRLDRYGVDLNASASRWPAITKDEDQQWPPDTEDLVGIDSGRDDLIKILTEEAATSSQQLKVVAIVGDGPVGKTTLAKVVYDSLAQQHFDLSAWVTLSSRPDITKILRGMLFQITQISREDQQEYIMRLDPKQLIDKIRRTLHDKRYLVIIDNILDEPEWELLKCALPDSTYGSGVLMTSRRVEHIIHYVDEVYKLKPLSEIDSEKLLYKRVFGSEDKCPPDLAEISRDFIEKFHDGIPLTIVRIARLLASKKPMKDEWGAVYASIYSGLLLNFEQIIGQHDLPPYLKPCLLYLSMFQKGRRVNWEHLVWQWIAEGFVCQTEGGEHYLNELVYRKLIEPIDIDAGGRVLSCSVNGMVHDLIISMSTGENFVTILNDQQGKSLPNMVNRLSIQGDNIDMQTLEGFLFQVRSLVVSGRTNLKSYLSKLRDLCVLDLGGCESLQNDDIMDVGNLFHLQCLIIGGGCITRIPESIANLINLETLDLRASGVIELPECVFQVKQLKHLYVNSRTKIHLGIEKLEALQELGDINISDPDLLKELCNLTNLKILRVAIWSWDESFNDPLLKYLGSLAGGRQSIQSLSILTCCSLHFLRDLSHEWAPQSLKKLEIIHSAFFELPKWMGSLQILSSLSIEVYKLTQDTINMMGQMSNLCSLSLTSKHAPEGMFGNVTDGFKKLTGFQFVSNAMPEMFAPGVMKMLTRLRISFQASRTKDICEDFNFGLENLSSLQHVRVDIICFNASRKVVKKAEDAIEAAISLGCSRCSKPDIRRLRVEDMIESDDEVSITNSKTGNEEVKKKKKRGAAKKNRKK